MCSNSNDSQNAGGQDTFALTKECIEAGNASDVQALWRGREVVTPGDLLYVIAGGGEGAPEAARLAYSSRGLKLLETAAIDCEAVIKDLEIILGAPRHSELWEQYERYAAAWDACKTWFLSEVKAAGGDHAEIDRIVAELVRKTPAMPTMPGRESPELRTLRELAVTEARVLGASMAGTEHVVLALSQMQCPAGDLMRTHHATRERLIAALEAGKTDDG